MQPLQTFFFKSTQQHTFAGNKREMIFSVSQNTITAYGYIWDGNGMEFSERLAQLERDYTNIVVKLHTYGGSVFDGNIMFNALANSKADIEIQIIGIAASMGAVLALSRKKVSMVKNGFVMIHTASGYSSGTATDHENTAKLLRSIEANFVELLVSKTGKSENYVKKWLDGDNWFDAKEALKEGLISAIIDNEVEIDDLLPEQLGATEVYNRFAAVLLPENSLNSTNMKKPLIEALALQGVTEQSSDTAIIEAVQKHYEAKETKLQNELSAEKKKREDLEAKIEQEGKAALTAEIDAAKKAGKITADQAPTYEAIGNSSGIEALKTVLAAIPARKPITSQIPNAGGKNTAPVGRDNWDWDKWQKEDPKGLEAMAKESPEEFTALYNQKYQK
jgi:ATP-dependent Clp endopeptidase proteolytic subunit ClpP